MFRQGQEVRDAADPDRIGIVVGTGSDLGARVLWCFDESLTWTSERPVVAAARTAADVLSAPEPGDEIRYPKGFTLIVDVVGDHLVEITRALPGEKPQLHGMSREEWAKPDNGIPVPHP